MENTVYKIVTAKFFILLYFMIIAVTGCPGSGKSLFTKTLAICGWDIIDADIMGREVLESNESNNIRPFGCFLGDDIKLSDGRLNRETSW